MPVMIAKKNQLKVLPSSPYLLPARFLFCFFTVVKYSLRKFRDNHPIFVSLFEFVTKVEKKFISILKEEKKRNINKKQHKIMARLFSKDTFIS